MVFFLHMIFLFLYLLSWTVKFHLLFKKKKEKGILCYSHSLLVMCDTCRTQVPTAAVKTFLNPFTSGEKEQENRIAMTHLTQSCDENHFAANLRIATGKTFTAFVVIK